MVYQYVRMLQALRPPPSPWDIEDTAAIRLQMEGLRDGLVARMLQGGDRAAAMERHAAGHSVAGVRAPPPPTPHPLLLLLLPTSSAAAAGKPVLPPPWRCDQ